MSDDQRGLVVSSCARKKLIPSATGLLVVSVLWMFFCLLYIAYFFPMLASPFTKPSERESLILFVGIMAFLLVYSAVLANGVFRMIYRDSYIWSVVISVLAMVPFLSPFFLLGIPFGLRILLVLRKSDIRESFRSVSHSVS